MAFLLTKLVRCAPSSIVNPTNIFTSFGQIRTQLYIALVTAGLKEKLITDHIYIYFYINEIINKQNANKTMIEQVMAHNNSQVTAKHNDSRKSRQKHQI